MRPFNDINIGDVYRSPLAWTGSDLTYTVVSKKESDKLVEVRCSYQQPSLAKTLWRRPSDKIFNMRLVIGAVQADEPEPNMDAIKTHEINILVKENRELARQVRESQEAIRDAIDNILERGGEEEWPIVKRLRSKQITGNWGFKDGEKYPA